MPDDEVCTSLDKKDTPAHEDPLSLKKVIDDEVGPSSEVTILNDEVSVTLLNMQSEDTVISQDHKPGVPTQEDGRNVPENVTPGNQVSEKGKSLGRKFIFIIREVLWAGFLLVPTQKFSNICGLQELFGCH